MAALPMIVVEPRTGLIEAGGEDEGTAEALSAVAIGMGEEKAGNHAQAHVATWHPIRITAATQQGMGIEGNSRNASVMNGSLVHIPGIEGGIGSQMGRDVRKRQHSTLGERLKIGHIPFIKRQGPFSEHDIAIVGGGGSGNPGAIAPDELFFLFGGSVFLLLIGGAFDAESALLITSESFGFVVAFRDIRTLVVFFHPGVHMGHIEGDDLTESGDLFLEITHGGREQGLEQVWVQGAQLVRKPLTAGKGLLDVKTIGHASIQMQAKAELNDEQGMALEEATELSGVDESFAKTQEKGFEIGALRMTVGATIDRTALLPLLNEGPIEQGEEGAVILNQGIMLQESSDDRLVKRERRGYDHGGKLLW